MSYSVSKYGHWRSYQLELGRTVIVLTNRVQLFEEKSIPSLGGWWLNIYRKGVKK